MTVPIGATAKSKAAYSRLMKTNPVTAAQWNTLIRDMAARPGFKDRARMDSVFVTAHNAVMIAETVPSKRKAIRAFVGSYA